MKLHLAGLLSLAALVAPAIAAADTLYDFTYTDTGITASGTIDVAGGQAISATGTISAGVLVPSPQALSLVTQATLGVNILDPATNSGATLSYRFGGGTDLIGDTVFNSSAPWVDSQGLVFIVGTPAGTASTGFNIWFNGGNVYAGFLAGNSNYNQFNGGSLVVTPAAVPLPGSLWLSLGGFAGLLGVAARRRKA